MMSMTELIRSQVYESLFMFASGLAFMILFEIFTMFKRKVCRRKFSGALIELLFWLTASTMTAAFLYKCAYGQLSFHAFCAFVLGAFLWKAIFYGIIDPGESKCSKEKPAAVGRSEKTIK